MTQSEIARHYYLSRTRVSRLLKEARDKGIVKIQINYDLYRHYELERRLCERFGLNEAYILNNRPRTKEEITQGAARLGADALRKHLKPDAIVGVTWGNSVASIVDALEVDAPGPLEVVQLMGAITHSDNLCSPQEIISKLVKTTGGHPNFLNMPFIIQDEAVRNALIEDKNNANTLRLSTFCDVILTGISAFDRNMRDDSWLGNMEQAYASELDAKDAVGCICGRFFDKEGVELDCAWNRQCVGITLSQLRRLDNVICIAVATSKAPALLAALKGKLFNVLVADGSTAAVLALSE